MKFLQSSLSLRAFFPMKPLMNCGKFQTVEEWNKAVKSFSSRISALHFPNHLSPSFAASLCNLKAFYIYGFFENCFLLKKKTFNFPSAAMLAFPLLHIALYCFVRVRKKLICFQHYHRLTLHSTQNCFPESFSSLLIDFFMRRRKKTGKSS